MNNPVIDKNGTKRWYNEEGLLHRLDGPAVIWFTGDKEWWINGKRHRLDGPAIEWVNGYKEWCQNGKHHRLDGPAIEWADGSKAWYQNDNLHRLDGPALEYLNGDKFWYIDDERLTEEEFNRQRPIEPEPMVNRFTALMDEINPL